MIAMTRVRTIGVLATLAAGLAAGGVMWRPGGAQAQQAPADTWTTPEAQRLGIRLIETRDPSGPPAYPVNPGDLLFFTNSGTDYGSKNSKNSVVVIDARTKRPIAVSDLDPRYVQDYGSHGIGLSPDGRYAYLPNLEAINSTGSKTPNATLILDARTLKIYQVVASGGTPHHAKAYHDLMGRPRVFIEDWTWNTASSDGRAFYVLDPTDNNKVVAGMTAGEIHGGTYTGFTTPDSRYLYYSVPPPFRGELVNSVNGWVAKIDMQSWRVVQAIPMKRFPLWTVFSKDGRWAWVSSAAEETVAKIQRGATSRDRDRVVAEVKTGPGPYGLRLSIDDRELWVADKGELGPKNGATITIVDTETNQVKQTLATNCIRNDHIVISPDGAEMWAACNASHEIVVIDAKTRAITHRIPMPNGGDSHGGVFVQYRGAAGKVTAEVVSDINGLQGSALAAYLKSVAWTAAP
jgi:DNA-binding beta-propeller fold protein YncE